MRHIENLAIFKLFKPLIGVFLSLGTIKITQILLPLFAIPWLARILDLRTFGIFMYFTIFPSIIETILNWGFELGAVREVAFYREGKHRQTAILGGVISAKLLLSLFCITGALIIIPLIPYAAEYPGVYIMAILYGIVRGFRPLWFYQGSGRNMHQLAFWEILTNFIILGLIILIINKPENWPYYFAFNFICKGFAYFLLIILLTKTWPFHLNLKKAWYILRKTRTLFANSLTGMVHSQSAKFVLGYFLLPAHLGIYMAADKIIKAIFDVSEPVSQTIYPEICALSHGDSKTANQMLFWSFTVTVGLMLIAAIILWLTSPWLIPLALGAKYGEAIPILDLMLFALPIMGMNSVIGPQILVTNGFERAYFLSTLCVAGLSIPLAMLLPTFFGLKGAAFLNIILSLFFFLEMVWCIRKYCPSAIKLSLNN